MPKQKKAARGKHRWVGIRHENTIKRNQLKRELRTCLDGFDWGLYDVIESKEGTYAILKTPLESYIEMVSKLNTSVKISSFTSSGKIRLVRKRLHSFVGKDPSNIV